MLQELFTIIEDRKRNPNEGSYTNRLFAEGEDRVLQKVGEETVEVLLAAKGQGRERLISETADLLYHVLVMLSYKGVSLGEVEEELRRRHAGSVSR